MNEEIVTSPKIKRLLNKSREKIKKDKKKDADKASIWWTTSKTNQTINRISTIPVSVITDCVFLQTYESIGNS